MQTCRCGHPEPPAVRGVLALVAATLFALTAPARADVFLKLQGIPGDSINALHKGEFDYYTITMQEIFVSEVTPTDTPDPARVVEKVVLNAAVREFAYLAQDPTGGVTPVKFHWDCTRNSE